MAFVLLSGWTPWMKCGGYISDPTNALRGYISDPTNALSGVSQGSVLQPLIYVRKWYL